MSGSGSIAIDVPFGSRTSAGPIRGALGTICRGCVKAKDAHVIEGISLLRYGLSAFRATGAQAWVPYLIALLAGACKIAGQVEEGLTLLDDAMQIAERTGERWFEAELNRLKGQHARRRASRVCGSLPPCRACSYGHYPTFGRRLSGAHRGGTAGFSQCIDCH